jgi:hypothetical protein
MTTTALGHQASRSQRGDDVLRMSSHAHHREHKPDRPVLIQQGGGGWQLDLGHGALGVAAATARATRLRVCVASESHRRVTRRDRRHIDPRRGRAHRDLPGLTISPVHRSLLGPCQIDQTADSGGHQRS